MQTLTTYLPKTKTQAFFPNGKDVYLIGRDQYRELIWLEAAEWSCGWYWSFGNVEVYTNQANPIFAKDITSHSHWKGFLNKEDSDGKYLHHINQVLKETVLSESESWKLSDLMQSFYTLQECAEVTGRGGSHLTTTDNPEAIKDKDMAERINKVLLPALFQEVYKILTPTTKGE